MGDAAEYLAAKVLREREYRERVDCAVVESLARQATYLLWRIEAACRYQAAMEQVVEFIKNPPGKSKDAILMTISTYLEQTMKDVKMDRPDYKVAILAIREAVERAT